ncbi:uncharacterized protein OCT59_012595 [Rhizophagus irregularis]|uniref:uncharacterized protein n=1 Tax=Rhizophagus irregularis TaxID=588596 RepID=UPI00332FC6A7|nr:hypothetical protein OCT59_012595 [Rhizophagus irregularis]
MEKDDLLHCIKIIKDIQNDKSISEPTFICQYIVHIIDYLRSEIKNIHLAWNSCIKLYALHILYMIYQVT